ncbi:MAG: cbb3-type cytochrome c oxidase subunit I [Actinomycetota bacterium]
MTRSDSAATRHLFTSAVFLAVGALLWLGALAAVQFPNLLPLSFGRLRAMAMLSLLIGWLVLGWAGAIYYLLPRLTGSPLRREDLLSGVLAATAVVVVAGMVLVGLGYGDGGEPFGLPWWWDMPVLLVFILPIFVTFSSLRDRQETTVYPSIWFAAAGVIWLPFLYVAGNLPGVSSIARALGDLVFTAGVVNVWGVGVATGVAYYVVPKVADQPLANRQLAKVGFWSLLFGAVWMGPVQLVAGPSPEWLQGVSAVLGLALPVAALANATNLVLTIGPVWNVIRERPVLLAVMAGQGLIVLGSVLAALAGFRSAAVLVGLTVFWEGILYLLLGGVVLLYAGYAWQALPNLVGRSLVSPERAVRLARRIATATAVTGLLLVLAGVASGFAWAGGTFAGVYVNSGAGWSESSGFPGLLIGLALLSALVAAIGQIGLALSVYRSRTSGRPTVQEVLVTAPAAGSGAEDE